MLLRPSMRENYRYILIRITPETLPCEAKDLYLAVSEAYSSFHGDRDGARAWVAVLEVRFPYAIIRCRRGTEPATEAAVATVTRVAGRPVALHPVKTSGTILTLREDLAGKKTGQVRTGHVRMNGEEIPALFSAAGRIDLKEKGINLHMLQYIAEEDIEDLYYDE